MDCGTCRFWKRGTRRKFRSEEQFTAAGNDEGHPCNSAGPIKDIITPADFGCINFVESVGEDQVEVLTFDGEPWQFWDMVPCPDCQGQGSTPEAGICWRCAGTSNVRKYADGYVGEEHTREHPRERALRLANKRTDALAKAQAEVARLQAEMDAEDSEQSPSEPLVDSSGHYPEPTFASIVARRGGAL